jgi:thioredoxin reductase
MDAARRLACVRNQLCGGGGGGGNGGGGAIDTISTRPGEHGEGRHPPRPAERSGRLLPDGRPMRQLPPLEPGSLDALATEGRYVYERQKRVDYTARFGEGNARNLQYPRIADLAAHDARFAAMLSDPFVQTPERAPLTDEVEYAILGGGFGGLCVGARLREQGVEASDIRIIDRGGDAGGTWYWNRYPGAMCDVESFCYMPLCEELGYVPSEKYAHQPELMRHSQRIMENFGLYERACFGTEVKALTWDEASSRWIITTDRGDRMRAKFAVCNFGVFSHPKLPAVPGVPEFEGVMMHTSRWDYSVTGGSSAGGLSNLKDKRVAIIGTGATAVQVIPHLGEAAKELYVFQRTPSTIDVRNNFHTTEDYAAKNLSKPGWQRERFLNFMWNTEGPQDGLEDLVSDGWTHAMARSKHVRERAAESGEESVSIRELMDRSDYEHVEQIRMRCDAVVQDPETAEVRPSPSLAVAANDHLYVARDHRVCAHVITVLNVWLHYVRLCVGVSAWSRR